MLIFFLFLIVMWYFVAKEGIDTVKEMIAIKDDLFRFWKSLRLMIIVLTLSYSGYIIVLWFKQYFVNE